MSEHGRMEPNLAGSADYELIYLYGSFAMREHFSQLRSAIARVRELDSTSAAHSFAIMQEDQTVLSGEDILRRACHPAPE